jgi:hypothetical protein
VKNKVPFLIPALFSVLISFTQQPSAIKIYAYSQAIAHGRDPGKDIINENGSQEKGNVKQGINYLIYLEYTRYSLIKPEQIWIHGVCYSIKSVILPETPVLLDEQTGPVKSKNTILVPKTSGKVLQLVITGLIKEPGKYLSSQKKLINESDLVVSYLWKGRMYYKSIKKIKMLEPIAAV